MLFHHDPLHDDPSWRNSPGRRPGAGKSSSAAVSSIWRGRGRRWRSAADVRPRSDGLGAARSARRLRVREIEGPDAVVSAGAEGAGAAVSADAELAALDERSLAALRQVGRAWAGQRGAGARSRTSLPVDPELSCELGGARRGRFVEIRSGGAGEEDLEAAPIGGVADTALGKIDYMMRRALVGSPQRSSAVAEERMGKMLALPLLSPAAPRWPRPRGDPGAGGQQRAVAPAADRRSCSWRRWSPSAWTTGICRSRS